MAVTNTQITERGADFPRVFARLTGAEFRLWMNDNGASVAEPPAHLSAEGALTWWDWNDGDGAFNGSNKYYASGMDDKRAYEWLALAETSFDADPAAFVNLCCDEDDMRALIVTRRVGPPIDLAVTTTKVAAWSAPLFTSSGATATQVAKPIDVFRVVATPGQYRIQLFDGTSVTTGDITEVLARLLALPAGRRVIRAVNNSSTAYSGLIYYNNPTTGRDSVFDLAATHDYRHGLSMAGWLEDMLDEDGVWRTFLSDLKDAAIDELGADDYQDALDAIVFDAELNRGLYYWQRGDTLGTAKTISSIDDGADTITFTAAHECLTGDAVIFAGGTAGGITDGRPYFARSIDSTTISLHPTPADASGNTNKIAISTRTGTMTRRTEVFDHLIADLEWETLRTTVFLPVISQANWNAGMLAANFATWWSWNTDHRALAMDGAFWQYYTGNLKQVIEQAQVYFPNVVTTEYEAAIEAKATHSWDHAGTQAFGTRNACGHSSLNLYGSLNLGYRWYWPLEANQNFSGALAGASAAERWNSLAMSVERLYAVRGASTVPFVPWLSAIDDGRYWKEIALMAAMCANAGWVNFYNTGVTNPNHQTFIDAIAEVDAVCVRRGSLEPCPLIPIVAPDLVYVRIWCGNSWVWRIALNPALSGTIEESGSSVEISAGDTELVIDSASVFEPDDPVSTLGYWVIQTFPPRSILLHSGFTEPVAVAA